MVDAGVAGRLIPVFNRKITAKLTLDWQHVVVVFIDDGADGAGDIEDLTNLDAGDIVGDRLGRARQHDSKFLESLFNLGHRRLLPLDSCYCR